MSQNQPTQKGREIYEPINGKEARLILKKNCNDKIDKIALFKEGNAFHKIHMVYGMTTTCYPEDCPVPELEFEKIILPIPKNASDELKKINEDKIKKIDDKILALDKKEEELLKILQEIQIMKQKIKPIIEIDGDLAAGKVPDRLRVEHGLPIPRLITSPMGEEDGKRYSEVYTKVDESQVTK